MKNVERDRNEDEFLYSAREVFDLFCYISDKDMITLIIVFNVISMDIFIITVTVLFFVFYAIHYE